MLACLLHPARGTPSLAWMHSTKCRFCWFGLEQNGKPEAYMSLARRRFALCFAIYLLPAAATADQISFTHRVDMSTRCVPGVGCSVFTESFPLTLTFDSAVTFASVDSLNGMEVHYGTPKCLPSYMASSA